MKASFSGKSVTAKAIVALMAVAVFVSVVLVAAMGCGQAGLVGKWVDSAGTTWEFKADGKMITSDEDMAGTEITYKVEGDTLTVSAMGQTFITAKFAVDGDTLKLTNPAAPGEVETMKRVK